MNRFENNKGAALISALFIMTLTAIAATAMAVRLQIDIYRARLEQTSDRIFLGSELLCFWAIGQLMDPKNVFLNLNKQAQVLQFPLKYKNYYPALTITGGIYDLQGTFNLNNLSDAKEGEKLLKLLQNTSSKVSAGEAKAIVAATADWIQPYDADKGEDPWLSWYKSQKPPYNISHLPFQSISEFRLVKGVSAPIYNNLVNWISVLPGKTPVNLNTASKTVLKTLGDGLSDAEVSEILNGRGKNGYANLDQVKPILEKYNIRPESITLKSSYFLVTALVSADKIRRVTYFIFNRSFDKENRITVQLIANRVNSL